MIRFKEGRSPSSVMKTAVILLLILLSRILAVAQGADPWLDEAMLMRNLPVPRDGLFQPLPLYHQGAPLGYLWLASELSALWPDNMVSVLRSLTAVTSLLGVVALLDALRTLRLLRIAPLVLALSAMTVPSIYYAIEIKHYGGEMAIAALLCAVGARMAVQPSHANAAAMLLALLIGVLFSFTLPIAAGSVFVAILAHRRWSVRAPVPLGSIVKFVIPFAIAGAAFLVLYLVYTRPVTAPQMQAYQHDTGFLPLPRSMADLILWLRLPWLLTIQIIPGVVPWNLVVLPAILIFGGAAAVALRRSVFFAAAFIAAVTTIYLLSLAHLFPIEERRHVLFMVPLSATVLAIGVHEGLAWGARRLRLPPRSADACVWLLALVVAAGGIYFALNQNKREQVTPLIALYRQQQQTEPLWVLPIAQPNVELLAPDLPTLGRIPSRTSMHDWLEPMWGRSSPNSLPTLQRPVIEQFRRETSGLRGVWLLFTRDVANASAILREAAAMDFECTIATTAVESKLYHCVRQPTDIARKG